MGRPKEFDPSLAVEQAMDVFWCRGYEGTSIGDLTDALGIGRASLYGAFGSKEGLWCAALDRYRELETARGTAVLDRPAPVRERFAALFDVFIGETLADPANRGCLMLNAAMERADDAATLARVQGALAEFERAFVAVLREGRDSGELAPDLDVDETARFLLTTLNGVRVMAKATRDERTVRAAAAVALRVLG